MALAAKRPYQYQSKNDPDMHVGTIAVTGSATVNLGVNHNNFIVVVCVQGALADLAPGTTVAYAIPTSSKGQFVIQVGKYSSGTWVAATAAVNVSFIAHVGNPV